jgi:N utilization substance protein B
MIGVRQTGRRLAFQALFEIETRSGRDPEAVLADRVAHLQDESGEEVSTRSRRFALALVRGTLDKRTEIDDRIARVAPAFPVDQMPVTDRVALEQAVYELLYDRRAPVGAVIDEAVELAKTYGGENSGRFVNGVLGTIAGKIQRTAQAHE